jgi:ketol-acid reductoisomerase
MKKVLSEIQSGEFARKWIAEDTAGEPVFKKRREEESQLLVEKVGAELRAKMSWQTGSSK